MRRRLARIFTAQGRPRLGMRGQEAESQLRLYGRGALLGAIGLAPILKCEGRETDSRPSRQPTSDTGGRDDEQQQ